MAIIIQLKNQLTAQNNSTNNKARGVTFFNNVFGGTDFKFVKFTVYNTFKPYGNGQISVNPGYNKKTRKTGVNPGFFEGKNDTFDTWII